MKNGDLFERIKPISDGEKPEKPVFSISFLDTRVDPLDDFFTYSCGKWVETHPIPEDKFIWGATMELIEWNTFILGKILEDCARKSLDHDEGLEGQLGKYYISAMDLTTINSLKFRPIGEMIGKIDGMKDKAEIPGIIEFLHRSGVRALFRLEVDNDEKQSNKYAIYLFQGGLTLPNRDYYLEDNFSKTRTEYVEHIAKMFELMGLNQKEAARISGTIMNMETEIAKFSRKPVELRDPEKNYNRIEMKDIDRIFGNIEMRKYLEGSKLNEMDYLIVGQPEFFNGISMLEDKYSLEEWKMYLKWKVLHFAAPYLHEEAEREDFDFFHRKLLGQNEMEKRWKKVVSIVDGTMGEALGKIYVDREFGEESRKRMNDMVEDLKEVFVERIKSLSWMGEQTKEKALEKFSRFRAKIGYPSKFIDYSSIRIENDDFFGNVLRCNQFEFNRKTSRAGKEVDHELWGMTPPTVNAYFSPTDNEIVFPAGILQPPFFDPEMDDAVNYGATGGTIAHEISHGFDDEGRKFDLDGNLKEWWTEDDDRAFMDKAKEVVELYSSQEVLPGLKVNGELTLGENIADLGGVSIAFEALQRRLGRNPEMRKTIDGFTPEQRFFLGWAQSWRESVREMALRYQISNDPHSPAKIRAEIPARVHEDFENVFSNLSSMKNSGYKKIKIW